MDLASKVLGRQDHYDDCIFAIDHHENIVDPNPKILEKMSAASGGLNQDQLNALTNLANNVL